MILLFNCTWVPEGPSEIRDSSPGCYTNIHLFILLLNISHVHSLGQWFKVPKICSFVSCAFWPFQNLKKYSYRLILLQCLKTFLPWGCMSAKVKSRHCPKILWYSYAIRDSKWIQSKREQEEAMKHFLYEWSSSLTTVNFFFFFPAKISFMRIMRYLCAYLWWALSNYAEEKEQKRLDEEFIKGLKCGLMFQQWGGDSRCTDRSLWRAWKVKKWGSYMILEGKGIVKAAG